MAIWMGKRWENYGKMMINLWDSKDGCWILMMIYYCFGFSSNHFDGDNDDL